MNSGEWLTRSTQRLNEADIPTGRLDCLVLMEDATRKDRSWLLAHPDHPLSDQLVKILDTQLQRRLKHEPLAYIRGRTEFYGREFAVNAHTLEPRPETEDMIDLLLEHWQNRPANTVVVDVGTGSGAIGITAALELSLKNIDLIDIDEEALRVARQNVEQHGLDLTCRASDLLTKAPQNYKIILANLPYVPDSHTINEAAMQEPPHAIFGGKDGLDLYRRLFSQAKAELIFTEALPFQHETLAAIAAEHGYKQIELRGFIQVFAR